MKTEFNYLPFYLGCAFTGKYKGWVHENNIMYLTWADLDPNKFEYIKLHLRPLSDMTDTELQSMHDQTIESKIDSEESTTFEFRPDIFDIPKLLKMGFDLFGLIESGQAIDATTLK
jgi:hypothetical protein